MPAPYQFDSYKSPYANTIASLLEQQGQIAAEGARARGQQAQQIAQSVNAGVQGVAAIPQQVRSEQAQQLDAELARQRVQQGRQSEIDLAALDKAYATPGGDRQILDALPGHLKPVVTKQLADAHAAASAAQEADVKAVEAFSSYKALIEDAAKKHGYDPASVQLQISQGKQIFATDPLKLQELVQMEQQIRANPSPEGVKQSIEPWARTPKLEPAAPGSSMRNPDTGQIVPGSQAPDPAVAQRAAAQAETERHNKESERIATMTSGREVASQQETARHNRAMEQLQNPFGAVTGGTPSVATATGTEGPTGETYLQSITDPAIRNQIKAYAEGRQPFPTGMSAYRLMPLIKMVTQYDPTFDAANYNARAKARTDLTSPNGNGGKTINALNTALQHAGTLSDLIEKLDNYGSPLANAVANPVRTAVGQTAVTNYKAVAPQLAKEIERAWRGSGGSTADIKDLINSIGSNLGKQQQREALEQFVELVKGKLDSTQQQRDNVMGPAGQSIQVLFDQNKAIIEKIAQRSGNAATTAGTPLTVGKYQVTVQP